MRNLIAHQYFKIDRRKLLVLGAATSGLLIVPSILKKDKAEAGMLGVVATGITLVNGLFKLRENIDGYLLAKNDSGRTQRGYVRYDIYDVDSDILEVSDSAIYTVSPGNSRLEFSCRGCRTTGQKCMVVRTAYGEPRVVEFMVV